MKYIFVVIFSLVTSMAVASRTATFESMGRIEVKKEARVSHLGKMSLGDIADFYNIPTKALSDLKKLVVGPAPKPNQPIYLTSQSLSEKFRQPLAVVQRRTGLRLMFRVPQRVTISHRPTGFSEENVRNEIIYNMQKTCSECRFEISSLQLPQGVQNQPGEWVIEFGAAKVKGQFSLPVVFRKNGDKKIFWVSGHLKKMKRMPIATRRLSVGDRVKKDDFKMKYHDVSFASDSAPRLDQLMGAKLRSGVNVDEVIWAAKLRKERALRFGELAEVLVGGDNWHIKTNAVAQQNADIGDTVRLLNPQTRKYISGTVIDKKKVRIE